jgi:hypothetical protein
MLTHDSNKVGRIDRLYNAEIKTTPKNCKRRMQKSEMSSSYDNNNVNPENDNDGSDGFDSSRGSAHAGGIFMLCSKLRHTYRLTPWHVDKN